MDLGVFQELHCKCNGKSIATSLSMNQCRDISFSDATKEAHQTKSSQKHTKNSSKMARNGRQDSRISESCLVVVALIVHSQLQLLCQVASTNKVVNQSCKMSLLLKSLPFHHLLLCASLFLNSHF
ncbi:hypothetical protein AB3S75_047162 [Citrus x aurantiifolia]